MRPTEVRLAEITELKNGDNLPVQVLRVGRFSHPKYGEFTITTQKLAEMIKNFKAKVRGVDIALDYFHDSDKEASGWIKELVLTEEGQELWATVDWTPKARTMLAEREVRYFSPDFAFVWKDPETGVTYNNVLFGGGLTNRPFVKEMAAIVADEPKETVEMDELKKLIEAQAAEIKKLSEKYAEGEKKMEGMQKKLDDVEKEEDVEKEPEDGADDVPGLKKKLAEMAEKHGVLAKAHEKLMAEMAEMKGAKELAEKTTAFNLMLSEGKACAAQKDAFLKGDMGQFVKLAQPVNLDGKGSNDSAEKTGDNSPEAILKLAEVKAKADKIELGDAISIIRKEKGIKD